PRFPELAAAHLEQEGLVRTAPTWKEFRARFLAEYGSGLRERSREKLVTVFDVFEEEMKPRRLADVNAGLLSRFAAALPSRPVRKRGKLTGQIGLAAWTIRNYLIALKTALGWAVSQKLLGSLPPFPIAKVPRLKPQPIPEADWLKLLAAAPGPLWQ